MKYIDVSGLDSYLAVRAKKEGMYVSEFLRYLLMLDATEHKELFDLVVDKDDERVAGDIEKFGLKI